MNHHQLRMPQLQMRVASSKQVFLPNMSQRLLQQQNKHHHHQQQQQQQQFTKPMVDVIKDSEKLQNDQQRLTSLHTKLHKEAEKIRHWKTEKEIELKKKDRSLSEAVQSNDSLRKSIIELQFQNEDFNTKLHEKELEKAETEQKLNTVREMATVLRDQMVQLETRILKGEQDKEDISQTNQKMVKENQNLVLKFQELDINQAMMIEKHLKQLKTMETKHEEQKKELQSNIRHLENQVIALMQTKTNQEQAINQYILKLKENEETITRISTEFDQHRQKLQSAEQALTSQEQNLSKLNKAFEETSDKLQESNQCLEETVTNLKNAENSSEKHRLHAVEIENMYSKEIHSLRLDIQRLNESLQHKAIELQEIGQEKKVLTSTISKMEEEISLGKHREEKNQTFIEQQKNEIQNLQQRHDQLNDRLSSCENQLHNAEEEINEYQKKTEEMLQQIDISNIDMTKIIAEKNSLEETIKDVQNHISELKHIQSDQKKLIEDFKKSLCISERENEIKTKEIEVLLTERTNSEQHGQQLQTDISSLQQRINVLERELTEKASIQSMNEDEIKNARVEINELQTIASEQRQQLEILSVKEHEQAETMKTELADKEKKAENLGQKTKSLQNEINEKSKQLKAVEKENKTIKIQLKNKTDKHAKLEEKLNNIQVEAQSLQEKFAEMENAYNKCESDLRVAKENFDAEQKEFCSTLEQYKLENDKIVASHMDENNAIKLQMETLRNEITQDKESMRIQLEEKGKTLNLQNMRVAELEKGVCEKDTQEMKICELQNSLENAKNDISLESERSKCLQQELAETFEKLEEEKQAKENLEVKLNQVGKRNQDRIVPTTPKMNIKKTNPKTPSSTLQMSSSKRDKRVLFAGIEGESYSSMELDEYDERSPKQILRTPIIVDKSLKNLRYSPKLSPLINPSRNEENSVKKLQRISRKSNEQKNATGKENSPSVNDIVSAHYDVAKYHKQTNNRSPPTPKPQLFASKRHSPVDVKKQSTIRHKMKKVVPKMKHIKDKNLDWFESDKVFGFHE